MVTHREKSGARSPEEASTIHERAATSNSDAAPRENIEQSMKGNKASPLVELRRCGMAWEPNYGSIRRDRGFVS